MRGTPPRGSRPPGRAARQTRYRADGSSCPACQCDRRSDRDPTSRGPRRRSCPRGNTATGDSGIGAWARSDHRRRDREDHRYCVILRVLTFYVQLTMKLRLPGCRNPRSSRTGTAEGPAKHRHATGAVIPGSRCGTQLLGCSRVAGVLTRNHVPSDPDPRGPAGDSPV